MRNRWDVNGRRVGFRVLVLSLVTAAIVSIVGLRIMVSGRWSSVNLVWNLILAWTPLLLALAACRQYRADLGWSWKLCGLAALWLLFFPNAPYIFTDLVHLGAWHHGHYWMDLALILIVALTGFMLGFLSLYLMQTLMAARLGWKAGWIFVLVVAGLTGMGIYLGRILRWNSWDAILHPLGVSRDVIRLAIHPLANAQSLAFQAGFGLFLFLGYIMLYAMAGLSSPASRATHDEPA